VSSATVVIPVLDDVELLSGLLARLEGGPQARTVVVDASSGEAVRALCARHGGVLWRASVRGRGIQMNAGAEGAETDWLLFLHADARLPEGWMGELDRAARASGIAGGCFRLALDSTAPQARRLERLVAWRTRVLKLPYGDQALFVRRDVFEALGGYRPWPLMEDVDLVRRLKRRGGLWRSDLPVTVSARRWEREGWIWRSAQNLALLSLFFLGVPPARLARLYDRRR
jgi:rSAM/selenodomain-associated transferase 2